MPAPRERSIILTDREVRAVLDGTMTQIRRIMKPQPEPSPIIAATRWHGRRFCGGWTGRVPQEVLAECPYGAPGDRLWVRESLWISECGRYFAADSHVPGEVMPDVYDRQTGVWYLRDRREITSFSDPRLDYAEGPHIMTAWSNRGRRTRAGRWIGAFDVSFADADTTIKIKPLTGNALIARYSALFRKRIPAIHVPRVACCLTLAVESVRVERLQAITEEDARAEGVEAAEVTEREIQEASRRNHRLAGDRLRFAALWTRINGAESWAANPWVWAVGFRVEKRPVAP